MPDSPLKIPSWFDRAAARRPLAMLWLAASLSTSGCLFHKTPPRAFVPPPVKPQPVAKVPVPWLDPAPVLEASLLLDPGPYLLNLTAVIDLQLPPPPRPAPPARRAGPVTPPAPPPAQQPQPQPAPPQIARILTQQELRDNTRIYNESMARVDKALNDLGKRSLTQADRDTLEQIKSFESQAKQVREQDLMTAVNLAKRADVLANDLLSRLR